MSEGADPIVYDYVMDIRFGDLDPYGHLNSTNYLDLVSSSRLLFLERELGCPISSVTEKGYGFFLTKAEMEFLKPVNGFERVRVRSHLAKLERGKLTIPYEMTSEDRARVFSRGTLEFYVVDLKRGKPVKMPEWMREYFYKPD